MRPTRAAARSSLPRMSGDDLVDHVEGLEQALDDVGPLVGLVEAVLGPAADDLDLVLDVVVEGLREGERAGHAVDERHHVARRSSSAAGCACRGC